MQKMIKLSDTHYIGVDDSEIKVGDIVAEKLLTGGYELFETHTPNDIDEVRQKKVTHSTQPLENINFVDEAEGNIIPKIKPLSLSEIRELLGMVDVEKKSYAFIKEIGGSQEQRLAYIDGYNEAIEDNKEKVFNKNDMIRLAIHCWNIASRPVHGAIYNVNKIVEDFMKPLLPKTEWECTIDEQGKLKLI